MGILRAGAEKSSSSAGPYYSRPDLNPPEITQQGPVGLPGPGYVCITPSGPMLVDDAAEPVWIRPVAHASTNLRVQRFEGKPVLTWWEGTITHYGVGQKGEYVILDSSYKHLMTVRARHGHSADLHEFVINGKGVAYFTAYHEITVDARKVGGPKNGTALQSSIQGVDLHTGELVFDWRSLDHIGIDESYLSYGSAAKKGFPYDPIHLNSIAPLSDGTLLVSARNTWALYKVDPSTGAIIWRLGGKKSDFHLGKGVRFAWQHDARSHPGGVVTLFDDEGDPPEAKQSRGLVLKVDEPTKTVSVMAEYFHPHKKLLAGSQGSVQFLDNGDVFVGWGAEPYYTEYRADGTVVLDAKIDKGESYRAVKLPWTGVPSDEPAVAARRSGRKLTLYASWNGSTETDSWEAIGGPQPGLLKPIGAARKTGFETPMVADEAARYVAVRALDANGALLATSRTIKA